MLETAQSDLPNEVRALQALLTESRAETLRLSTAVKHQELTIEKLKLQIAQLRRMRFGRSSEKLAEQIEQLELLVEELETPAPALIALKADEEGPKRRPARKPLPEHLPREAVIHSLACTCPDCGGALRSIGEDVSETLEYVPEHWKVIRHVRPKLSCDACDKLIQVSAPVRPIAKGIAGPGLLGACAPEIL